MLKLHFFSAAAPSKPSPPTVILKTTHILKIMFTVEEGSYPMTSLLLNTTQLLSNGGSSTTQEQIEISNVLYVDSVEALTRKQYKIVLTVRGLEQLTFYTFKVAAISAAGEGEFSEPSTPTTLGKFYPNWHDESHSETNSTDSLSNTLYLFEKFSVTHSLPEVATS